MTVTPLIVVGRPESISTGKKKPSVTVLASSSLYRYLKRRPRVHSDEAVAYFFLIAAERGTWHTQAVVTNDTLRHIQRFERLQIEVESARRRLWGWLLLAVAGLITVPIILVTSGALAVLGVVASGVV